MAKKESLFQFDLISKKKIILKENVFVFISKLWNGLDECLEGMWRFGTVAKTQHAHSVDRQTFNTY